MRIRIGTGVVAVLLMGALFAALPAFATAPGTNGRIFFASDRDGNREIYTVNPDGTVPANLTKNPATDDSPSPPPLGSNYYVAIMSNRSGDNEIYLLDQVGFNAGGVGSGLSASPASDIEPATGCCPHYLFVSDRDGNNEIYLRPPGDTNIRLTNNPASDTAPAWSPDDRRIAFVSDRDGNNEIYVMNIDGSGQTRLTNDPSNDSWPNWSPDGSKIAFETNRDGNFEIYVMNADGTGATNITNNPAGDRHPSWSPDGTKIAFQSNRDGNFEIYTMNADGTNPFRVTNSPGADVNPEWAPVYPLPHVRPKGATPLRASLVPAYQQCTAPNQTHAAPLAYPSCRLADHLTPESPNLTAGTPDANAAAAQFTGVVLLRSVLDNPSTPTVDETDMKLDVAATDIRCYNGAGPSSVCSNANANAGRDYAGELEGRLSYRLTDNQTGNPHDSTTLQDGSLTYPITCTQTASTSRGSDCGTSTSVNALLPGAVARGTRQVWQLEQLHVYDGGPDGVASTAADNSPFLRQGLFVP